MSGTEITNAQLLQLLNKRLDEQYEKISNKIDKNHKDLENEIRNLNKQIDNLKEENIQLRDRISVIEKKKRKNNLVVFGLKPTDLNPVEDTINELSQKLGVELDKSDISNLYVPKQNQTGVPIHLEFLSFFKKAEVLKNSFKLKNSGISVANDMSKEEREIHKVLRKKIKEARENGHEAKFSGNGKIKIDGVEHHYKDIIERDNFRTENSSGTNTGSNQPEKESTTRKPSTTTKNERPPRHLEQKE